MVDLYVAQVRQVWSESVGMMMNPFEQYRGINPPNHFFLPKKTRRRRGEEEISRGEIQLRHADEIKKKKARIKEKGIVVVCKSTAGWRNAPA